MAKKINGNVLTEKGVVKTKVRETIVNAESKRIESLGFERVDNKNLYVSDYVDSQGNEVYAVLELRVSTIHPTNLAPKKSHKKSSSGTKETFEIVEE